MNYDSCYLEKFNWSKNFLRAETMTLHVVPSTGGGLSSEMTTTDSLPLCMFHISPSLRG